MDHNTCEMCKAPIERKSGQRGPKATVCSPACRQDYKNAWQRRNRKPPPSRPCKVCGQPTTQPSARRCDACLAEREARKIIQPEHCSIAGCTNPLREGRNTAVLKCEAHQEWRIGWMCVICGEPRPHKRWVTCGRDCGRIKQYGYYLPELPPEMKAARASETKVQALKRYRIDNPVKPPLDQRSPLRKAYEANDRQSVIDILLSFTEAEGDCRVWTKRVDNGYPMVSIGARQWKKPAHRIMCEAAHGLASYEACHHKCANTRCIRPEHLEPISHRENAAEMLQRSYYLKRIAELEFALAAIDPMHEVLTPRLLVSLGG